jgi:hypothetical protein
MQRIAQPPARLAAAACQPASRAARLRPPATAVRTALRVVERAPLLRTSALAPLRRATGAARRSAERAAALVCVAARKRQVRILPLLLRAEQQR